MPWRRREWRWRSPPAASPHPEVAPGGLGDFQAVQVDLVADLVLQADFLVALGDLAHPVLAEGSGKSSSSMTRTKTAG